MVAGKRDGVAGADEEGEAAELLDVVLLRPQCGKVVS